MNHAENHKAGFVNIVGNPNVGKSTLLNAMVGEQMSIATSKPQTTRHRILGFVSEDHYQIVFSDTPGLIESPQYGMQSSMNKFAYSSFEDADIILLITDIYDKFQGHEPVIKALEKISCPTYLIINKIDQDKDHSADNVADKWMQWVAFDKIFKISALNNLGLDALKESILHDLPLSPPYFPKDDLSDKSERFFASEMIRESIFNIYKQEVPYSCEVLVTRFKEETKNERPILMVYADIYVDRKSQKPILIGKNGEAIKKLGMASRSKMETFFGTHVFLDLNVKIKENWRDDEKMLKYFGYED